MGMTRLRILLASPRGFCAGVDRAIEIVERALDRYGAPVYVRHEIVHNQHVVDDLRAKGAIFVDMPNQAPQGSHLIYSAHGVSPVVRAEAAKHGLSDIDATCPLVTKVHNEVKRMVSEGYDVVMIDCPPSLGVLTINALSMADEVIVPMQAHFLALWSIYRFLRVDPGTPRTQCRLIVVVPVWSLVHTHRTTAPISPCCMVVRLARMC